MEQKDGQVINFQICQKKIIINILKENKRKVKENKRKLKRNKRKRKENNGKLKRNKRK